MSRILKGLSETKKDEKGFMPTPRQVPAPPGGHPVPPGYERVKSWGGAYELRKKTTEGEVVSMQARKTPLVIAGSPYDWDIYDLRTNKMVANILGGDRHESPLYEVRINRNGMTKETRMLPTYVVTSGPNNNPPHKAFELEAPAERDKIEKSPGPGGTTKLRPDNMDVIAHLAKMTGQGKYYGYDTVLVEEGLDPYELIEKALGAKIMEIDDAMELGYTDEDPEDSSSIVYLGNQKNEDTAYAGGMGQGGNAGQSYRKYKAKPAGLDEEQIPMFTPEEKMVNANDPHSDGWRLYKTKESSIMKGIQSEEQVDEYKEVPGQRKIEFSKENPPDLYYLYQQFIQRMLNPENTIDPKDWIEKVNNHYGLNYSWKDYQKRGHNDHTDNWQKIINKYVLKKS